MAVRRHDVVVVGGGVVGAATALALLRQGCDVALVERGGPAPAFDPSRYDPRVYALSPGSVAFLESLGAWPRIAAARASPYVRMEVWEHSPAQALAFDAAQLAVPELGFIVEDALLRAMLWAAVGVAATILPNAQVSGLERAAGRVRLTLANGDVLDAALVVAAEGADSPLRDWAGIEPLGWSYEQRAVVCHVETQKPHERTAYQRFLPRGPLALLPLADGRSSIVWSTATAEADELLALDDDGFRARLDEALGHALGDIGACTPRTGFPLRGLHAERYVAEGLALVGDSAHVIHPLAGQGLNLGLADAQALAAVVGEARAQRKPPGRLRVLQRYERRRKAGNVEVLALTDGLHRLFGMRGALPENLRELGLSLVNRAGPVRNLLARRAMGAG